LRVPTSDLHATNACWSLFLLSTYLVVAEAASFDKKELMQERYTRKRPTFKDQKQRRFLSASKKRLPSIVHLYKMVYPTKGYFLVFA